MKFYYEDIGYDVEIIKKKNKNTYIRVRDGKIVVTTNYFISKKRIQDLLKENQKNIYKMLDQDKKRMERKELFFLFGKSYDLIYGNFEEKITFKENKIYVVNEKVFHQWLDNLISSTFYYHLMEWYQKFEEEIPMPNLKIRKMKTRWGVCNTKTYQITLNRELYRYEVKCLDYVIIHELSHLLVPNHSKDFWKVVEKYCPDYKKIKVELRS